METFLKQNSKEEIIQTLNEYYERESHDLLSAISHDIKNPLGIIDLSLGLLEDRLEKILQNTDPVQADKVRSFVKNINIGIERCQEILENTMLIRSSSEALERTAKKMQVFDFFENFSIFAKPSFKRAKLSLDNCIDPTIEKEFELKTTALLLISFLKVMCNGLSPESNIVMKVEFIQEAFKFTISSMHGEVLSYNERRDDQSILTKERFNQLVRKLKCKTEISSSAGTEIVPTLSCPKA